MQDVAEEEPTLTTDVQVALQPLDVPELIVPERQWSMMAPVEEMTGSGVLVPDQVKNGSSLQELALAHSKKLRKSEPGFVLM